jgi:pimeloyl-ACP methyl ester carboxylesterase
MLKRTLKLALAGLALAGATLGVHAAAEPTSFKVTVTGQGRPMILIPGLASSAATWDSTLAHYAGRYQFHVLNLAGFAGVPAVPGATLKQVEQELADYIASQHLDHPVIVGHSLGGFLALQLAADHPGLAGKLVIVDSLPALGATQMPDITPGQLKSAADRMRDAMLQSDPATQDAARQRTVASMVTKPEDVARVVDWGVKSDRAMVVNAMHDIMATDLRQDVARIQAPTLVLGTWVAYKAFAPRSAIESVYQTQYAKLPGVKLEMADNARHFIMYDDPQWMFERMDAFLLTK